MVAVPAYAAANVQQDLIEELQHGGNLRADDLGRVKMPCVQRIKRLAADGIAQRIFMACDRVALHAKAKELALHRGEHRLLVVIGREDFIQRLRHDFAALDGVHTRVLVSIRHPEVHRAGLPCARRKRARDLEAALAVLHPETALVRVKTAQRKIPVHHGMRKIRGVEVEADVARLGPA